MEKLPEEIQKIIFLKIHPIELMKLRSVCKSWKCYIDEILSKLKIFKKWCQTDPNIKPWVEKIKKNLSALTISSKLPISSAQYWREILFSYERWQKCFDNTHNKIVINNLPVCYKEENFNNTDNTTFIFNNCLLQFEAENNIEMITAMDVYAQNMIIVTDHIVYFCKIQKNNVTCFLTFGSRFDVKEVRFWMTNTGKLLIVLHLDVPRIEFWDFEKGERITDVNIDRIDAIFTGPNYKLFSVHSDEIQNWQWDSQQSVVIRGKTFLNPEPDHDSYLSHFYANGNSILAIRDLPGKDVWVQKIIHSSSLEKDYQINTSVLMKGNDRDDGNYSVHMPLTGVVFLYNAHVLRLIFCRDDSIVVSYSHKWSELLPNVEEISSILFHANVILLGTEQGRLLAHNVNLQDFKIPNLILYNPREIQNFNAEINKLYTTEIEESIYIIVQTDENIFVLESSDRFTDKKFRDIFQLEVE